MAYLLACCLSLESASGHESERAANRTLAGPSPFLLSTTTGAAPSGPFVTSVPVESEEAGARSGQESSQVEEGDERLSHQRAASSVREGECQSARWWFRGSSSMGTGRRVTPTVGAIEPVRSLPAAAAAARLGKRWPSARVEGAGSLPTSARQAGAPMSHIVPRRNLV
ncbi:uncharacterized protein PSFLO_04525 [Pseudozyma flocculosa]|uniref:Secreted protein n=1 Tax=Pseudozyma flocculosa TaxID=84751 RepID=A0A5C3F502_9BASI|nr:uncharacterized protein PSFLO_04525 [Pseudozyma flocculosa]